jgi:hypothetical protein
MSFFGAIIATCPFNDYAPTECQRYNVLAGKFDAGFPAIDAAQGGSGNDWAGSHVSSKSRADKRNATTVTKEFCRRAAKRYPKSQ